MQLRLMCSDSDAKRNITIPMDLGSSNTIEFLAFIPERAVKLFESCIQLELSTRQTEGRRLDLLACATAWVEQTCASDDEADWAHVMTEAGIKENVIVAFTEPAEHAFIWGIQSLDFWLVEINETNHHVHVGLEKKVNERLDEAEEVPQART
jgi:hypothetical protein